MTQTNSSQPDFPAYIDKWHSHIRSLAHDIGPRGSTTEAERQGAEYCKQALEQLGLAPRVERFTSARSIFQPNLFASLAMIIAFAIYPIADRVSATFAALVSLLALIAGLLELSFRSNPLRWIVSKGPSQNVVATLPPIGEHRQDLVLIGHIDSQRTPLIFKTPRWLAAYKAFTTIAFIAFSGQAVLYTLGTLTQWNWIWPVSSFSALCAVLLAAICIQKVSQQHPELNAYPSSISGGDTEMADALRAGIPAITLIGLTPESEAPYWHMVEDTIDKIDPSQHD